MLTNDLHWCSSQELHTASQKLRLAVRRQSAARQQFAAGNNLQQGNSLPAAGLHLSTAELDVFMIVLEESVSPTPLPATRSGPYCLCCNHWYSFPRAHLAGTRPCLSLITKSAVWVFCCNKLHASQEPVSIGSLCYANIYQSNLS